MNTQEKIKIIFLTIITFGFIWLYWNRLKKRHNTENQITKINETNIDIRKLIDLCGGKENIITSSNTHTRVQITFNNKQDIRTEEINAIKEITGVAFGNDNKLNIIVGKVAEYVSNQINERIK